MILQDKCVDYLVDKLYNAIDFTGYNMDKPKLPRFKQAEALREPGFQQRVIPDKRNALLDRLTYDEMPYPELWCGE